MVGDLAALGGSRPLATILYNREMTSTLILVPFGLPPAAHARDLIDELRMPALAQLLSRGRADKDKAHDPFAALLPHERRLSGANTDCSPPLAHALMRERMMPLPEGTWFLLQPAHFHIARDHLVLTDLRTLPLQNDESRMLFDAAAPSFLTQGLTPMFVDAHCWLLRADRWQALRTCSPDAACGHNVDVWLPRGEVEREWRRLHNEVQMLWHAEPLNEARERAGLPRVNALWLWGASQRSTPTGQDDGLQALVHTLPGRCHPPAAGAPICIIDTLLSAALADDWASWRAAMMQAEAEVFAPLLSDLTAGRQDTVTLVLTDATRERSVQVRRRSLRKFWIKPTLHRLLP